MGCAVVEKDQMVGSYGIEASLSLVRMSSSVRERRKKRFLSEEEKRYCVKGKILWQETEE